MKYIQGSGGGGKGGNQHTPIEEDDSLQSIQYAEVTDLLSEGQVQGLDDGFKSIFFMNILKFCRFFNIICNCEC